MVIPYIRYGSRHSELAHEVGSDGGVVGTVKEGLVVDTDVVIVKIPHMDEKVGG
jgi:hypothetical protein